MVTYWRALFETQQNSRLVIITPSSREKIFINYFSIQIQHAGRGWHFLVYCIQDLLKLFQQNVTGTSCRRYRFVLVIISTKQTYPFMQPWEVFKFIGLPQCIHLNSSTVCINLKPVHFNFIYWDTGIQPFLLKNFCVSEGHETMNHVNKNRIHECRKVLFSWMNPFLIYKCSSDVKNVEQFEKFFMQT